MFNTILIGDSTKLDYDRQGWYVSDTAIRPELIAVLRESVARISVMKRPEVVHEEDGSTVRALHGCHRFDKACADLVCDPALVDLAEMLVGEQVYVYQFKINIKGAKQGQRWPWHQDYAFWSVEDGMPADDAVNIAISLDQTHEGNGPLTLLTGSHRIGLVDPGEPEQHSEDGDDWRKHVSAKLSHSIADEKAAELAQQFPPHRLLGPEGTVTAFHPSIVHSSSDNTSDDSRTVLIITYNSIRNTPTHVRRPAFLVDPDSSPIVRLGARA